MPSLVGSLASRKLGPGGRGRAASRRPAAQSETRLREQAGTITLSVVDWLARVGFLVLSVVLASGPYTVLRYLATEGYTVEASWLLFPNPADLLVRHWVFLVLVLSAFAWSARRGSGARVLTVHAGAFAAAYLLSMLIYVRGDTNPIVDEHRLWQIGWASTSLVASAAAVLAHVAAAALAYREMRGRRSGGDV